MGSVKVLLAGDDLSGVAPTGDSTEKPSLHFFSRSGKSGGDTLNKPSSGPNRKKPAAAAKLEIKNYYHELFEEADRQEAANAAGTQAEKDLAKDQPVTDDESS